MMVCELLKQIFLSRNNNEVNDFTLAQLELFLKQGYPVHIHTILRENDTNIISIEVFSIHLMSMKENMQTLPNIFLKNALNSFLYFSQFNAWLLSKTIPDSITYSSRISLQKTLSKDVPNCIIEKKSFPLTIIDNNVVKVSVKYLKGDFPTKIESKYPIPKEVSFNSLGPEKSVVVFGNNYKSFNDNVLIIGKQSILEEFNRRGIYINKIPAFTHLIVYFNNSTKYGRVS